MKNKLIGTICLVLGIIIIVTTGTSFAYFTASAAITGDPITGTTTNFDVELKVEETYKATQLIPLYDTLIGEAVKNNCTDKKGYQVCSLYKITLTNSGDAQVLNGYITATEETNYITENVKAKLFDSNLTSISGITTLTNKGEINIAERKYFKIDETKLFTTEITNEKIFYLAIWLTETDNYQNDDYSKNFYGTITFESIAGEEITAKFNA